MKMELNMLLLAQPQKELQLDLKTSNVQNHRTIELYRSPTTKDLKKPHACRWVEGAETGRGQRGAPTRCATDGGWPQNRRFHIHVRCVKVRRNTLGYSLYFKYILLIILLQLSHFFSFFAPLPQYPHSL